DEPGAGIMSAFMVSAECVNRVVFAMRAAMPGQLIADPDMLGRMLGEMTRRALMELGDVVEVAPFRYVEPAAGPFLLMQTYKSVCWFFYQCSSNGTMPSDHWLYLALVGIRGQMAKALGHDGE